MGACWSAPEGDLVASIDIQVTKAKKSNKDLNPADFKVASVTDGVVVKKPGDVDGVQFLVEDCTNSHVILVDMVGPIAMDNCKGCTVVVGPSDSSVFIRDCSDCDIIVGCQQLRLRDCRNVRILLHSQTGPIIESSSGIKFGCYSYDYFGIGKHFKEHNFCVLKNLWYSVYDFTPATVGKPCNHQLMVPEVDHSAFMDKAAAKETWEVLAQQGLAPTGGPMFIPRSCGPQFADALPGKTYLLCALAVHQDALRSAIEGWPLVRGTCSALSRGKLGVIFTKARVAVPVAAPKTSIFGKAPPEEPTLVVVLVLKMDGVEDPRAVLVDKGISTADMCLLEEKTAVDEISRLVFDVWTQEN